jgi:transposase
MDTLIERCAGIDIGKDEMVACVRTPKPGDRARIRTTRTFATFTASLEAMIEWFAAEGVTAVVMEATGSYWKPVWYLLEEHRQFELLLVNAHHVKILPGRKSDVLDAEWLAELLEHGLLRGSFVPPRAIRELRDLTRYRKRMIQSPHQRVPAHPEDPRGRWDQAGLGGLRRPRGLGAGDAGCAGRRGT